MSTETVTVNDVPVFEATVSVPCGVAEGAVIGELSCESFDFEQSAGEEETRSSVSLRRRVPKRSLVRSLQQLHFTSATRRQIQYDGVVFAPHEMKVATEISERTELTDAARGDSQPHRTEKRRVPRCPGSSLVTVAVVPQHQGRSDDEQRWNFLSTPIRGSVLFINDNGVSLSLNSPVTESGDIVLQMTHPTFRQSCTVAARVLRCEQIGTLWHVACAFHQPISVELMNSFCQLIQPRVWNGNGE